MSKTIVETPGSSGVSTRGTHDYQRAPRRNAALFSRRACVALAAIDPGLRVAIENRHISCRIVVSSDAGELRLFALRRRVAPFVFLQIVQTQTRLGRAIRK